MTTNWCVRAKSALRSVPITDGSVITDTGNNSMLFLPLTLSREVLDVMEHFVCVFMMYGTCKTYILVTQYSYIEGHA